MNYKKLIFTFCIVLTTELFPAAVPDKKHVQTSLLEAIKEANITDLESMLPDVKEIDEYEGDLAFGHRTVFMAAFHFFTSDWHIGKFNEKRFNIIKLLLTKKPDLTYAIINSVYYGCFELFELLFHHITNINCEDFSGKTIALELVHQINNTDPKFSTKLMKHHENLLKIANLFLTHPALDYSNEKVVELITTFDFEFIDFNKIETENLLKVLITSSKWWMFSKAIEKTKKLTLQNLSKLLIKSNKHTKIFRAIFDANQERLKEEIDKGNYSEVFLCDVFVPTE